MLSILPRLRFPCLAMLGALACSYNLSGYTKTGTTYTTKGSQSDVSAAIARASAGDTVSIPAGSFTWGDRGSFVAVNKAITLQGAGQANTTIQLSTTGPTVTSGTIRISAPATVRGFTILAPASGNHTTPFSTFGSKNGWRITDVKYDATGKYSYFIYVGKNYGLIDNCTIIGGGGSNELIFARGPSRSWQTTNSMGTASALYVEDCTFSGRGYVCDINDNGRAVIRFNTITANMKIDGHGYASNSIRGVRQMEIYNNHWTAPASSWAAVELRGGTGMLFDNVSDYKAGISVHWPVFTLKEYGCLSNAWGHFGKVYQTPAQYPIIDQIGVGMDPKVGGSEPVYLWNNTYGGVDWELGWTAIPAGAITKYQIDTKNPSATFTMRDIIAADRDYFKGTVGGSFDGSSGVGRGTKAQMQAITPTKTGVGYWVTDEGEWNSFHAGPDGCLYVWNGRVWVLKYQPYTYPHPLRGISDH